MQHVHRSQVAAAARPHIDKGQLLRRLYDQLRLQADVSGGTVRQAPPTAMHHELSVLSAEGSPAGFQPGV
jgi:hypothetical protein